MCYCGAAGFMGSLIARREKAYRAIDLVGIGSLALILIVAGSALMMWSGFSLRAFDVEISGVVWALLGVISAVVVVRKEDHFLFAPVLFRLTLHRRAQPDLEFEPVRQLVGQPGAEQPTSWRSQNQADDDEGQCHREFVPTALPRYWPAGQSGHAGHGARWMAGDSLSAKANSPPTCGR